VHSEPEKTGREFCTFFDSNFISLRPTMVKARVGVRLKEAVVGTTQSKNRSADLSQLTEKYNDFCKKLRGLITSLKGHYASMHQLQKNRLEVTILVEIFVTCFSVPDPRRTYFSTALVFSIFGQVAFVFSPSPMPITFAPNHVCVCDSSRPKCS
jgi:hypothetical protein